MSHRQTLARCLFIIAPAAYPPPNSSASTLQTHCRQTRRHRGIIVLSIVTSNPPVLTISEPASSSNVVEGMEKLSITESASSSDVVEGMEKLSITEPSGGNDVGVCGGGSSVLQFGTLPAMLGHFGGEGAAAWCVDAEDLRDGV